VAQEKKSTAEMLGEFLRDVGVLVLVFYPLELRGATRGDRELMFAVSALCLVLGIIFERGRRT